MEKPADNQYPIHDLFVRRWSPRAFSDRMVEQEKLFSLLEAARWAPSCLNEQPWSFIVATKESPALFDQLLQCLKEGNIVWAQHAPVLMISVARLHFERNGNENRHAFHDVGLAAGNLVSQATALGLFVHQMGGFDSDKARAEFHIPETHAPVAAIAIGYLGEMDKLPEEVQQKEVLARSRKTLDQFVFSESWNQPFVGSQK